MSCYVHDGFFLPYVSRPRQRKLVSPSKYGVSKVLTFQIVAKLGEKRFIARVAGVQREGRGEKGERGKRILGLI